MRARLGVAAMVPAAAILLAGCGGRAAGRLDPEADAASGRPAAEPALRLFSGGPPAGSARRTDGETAVESPALRSVKDAPERGEDQAASSPTGGGLYQPLRPGRTLYSMARTYGVPLRTLMRVNGIKDPKTIPDGKPIFIPGARRQVDVPQTYAAASLFPLPALAGTGPSPDLPGRHQPLGPPGVGARPAPPLAPRAPAPDLVWPIRGAITSRFGPRGRRSYHDGIDIRGPRGEIIEAAAAGVVVRAGTGRGYGKMIIVDHGDGLRTLYAHASRLLVHAGDRVDTGDPIAEVGRTGNARGEHLHFEVRRDGRPVDPRPLLDAADGARAEPRPTSQNDDGASLSPSED